MTTVISGPKCLEPYGKLNPSGLWSKTFIVSLIGSEGLYSRRCILTWKRKVTPYKRLLFQLVPSMLPTEEIGFGLLPTSTASEIMQEGMNGGAIEIYIDNTGKPRRKLENGSASMGVARMAQAGLLPTPTAMEIKDSQLTSEQAKKLDKGGRVLRRLGTLDMIEDGKTSQLNPRFVAEMMGFPPNWTELPFQNGETNPSKPTETP